MDREMEVRNKLEDITALHVHAYVVRASHPWMQK